MTNITNLKTSPPDIMGLNFSNEEIQEAIMGERILLLTLFTQMTCNLRCPYCFTSPWLPPKGNPLSLKDYRNLFQQAKDFGAKSVWWVGIGEPLLFPDFKKIVQEIYSANLALIVFTNGTRMSVASANLLLDINASIFVKCNSFTPSIQNALCGDVEYAFERISETLNLLIQLGFNRCYPSRLGIQSIIAKQNLTELPSLYKWARMQNIIPLFEMIIENSPCLAKSVENLQPSLSDIEKLYNLLLEIDENTFNITWEPTPPYVGKQCDKFLYTLSVDPYGNVMSCAASNESVGNIKDISLSAIWKGPFFQTIRNIYNCLEGKCGRCELVCAGCRSEAFAKSGSFFAEYPRCWRK